MLLSCGKTKIGPNLLRFQIFEPIIWKKTTKVCQSLWQEQNLRKLDDDGYMVIAPNFGVPGSLIAQKNLNCLYIHDQFQWCLHWTVDLWSFRWSMCLSPSIQKIEQINLLEVRNQSGKPSNSFHLLKQQSEWNNISVLHFFFLKRNPKTKKRRWQKKRLSPMASRSGRVSGLLWLRPWSYGLNVERVEWLKVEELTCEKWFPR